MQEVFDICNGIEFGIILTISIILWQQSNLKGRNKLLLRIFSLTMGYSLFESVSYYLVTKLLNMPLTLWRMLNLFQLTIIPFILGFVYYATHTLIPRPKRFLCVYLFYFCIPFIYLLFPHVYVYYGLFLVPIPFVVRACWSIYQSVNYFNRQVQEFYSDSTPYTLTWVFYFCVLSGILLAAFIVSCVFPSMLMDSIYFLFKAAVFMGMSYLVLFRPLAAYIPYHEKSYVELFYRNKTSKPEQPELEENTPLDITQQIQQKLATLESEEKFFLVPDITLFDLASSLGTNVRYLSVYLNHTIGKTFNRYINELRINYAEKLLTTTDDSLESIALSSGYEHYSRFHRQFTHIMGISPGEYRKQHLTKSQNS